jgi:glycosyltransferase involved in cell wall biosynthesis
MKPTKKVLVYRSVLLPYSETFIKEQVLAYSSWRPVLMGNRKIESVLPLDGIDVRVLEPVLSNVITKTYRRALGRMRIPDPRVFSQFKSECASLIHIHFGMDAAAIWPIVRLLGLPTVVTLHGYDINVRREWWEKNSSRYDERRYPARLLQMAMHRRVQFVAVSEAIRQRAIEYGIPPTKVVVKYIGINLNRFQSTGKPVCARPRRVLFVGRLVEKKGGEVLIEAFARVQASVPDAELVIIGDGPLLDKCKQLARQLKARISFLGSLDNLEVKRQMDEARVFCLPSVTAENGDAEGLPMSLLEAQCCGIPVVTSARGGATEGIVDNVTGFAFPERDVAALSKHLIRLLCDDSVASSMSRAGPQFVAKGFDIRRCTQGLEALYDTLVHIS